MTKEMLINAQPDECRIAIVTDGAMTELYIERASSLSRVGNIYKGRITNVEPSIQAAFVDFGRHKHGFLHISDLHPQYFPGKQKQLEAVGKKRTRRDRPPIQTCLQRGQDILIQVTKDGIGTKGATLTTYLSIPGRYLVLMPGLQRLGVSRKIEDETARTEMRTILEDLKPPENLGFIVRTAGMNRSRHDLQRDMHYLVRLWKNVEQRSSQARAPAEIYQESDLVIRTIRDIFNSDIRRIICDDEAVSCKVKEFLRLIMPRTNNRVDLYTGEVGLFHAFGLEQEIEKINTPRVSLPAGGSLVIDQTEALVAIDVNSGRYRESTDAETMALRTNSEAAHEIPRQLRLRDLGGVIIIDFIDMIEEGHRRQIEKILRTETGKDRARTKILRTSRFGIVEMTRQRVKPSLASATSYSCPHCGGAGRVRSPESQALAVMRTLRLAANDENIARIEVTVTPAVAEQILNNHREDVTELEQVSQTRILVHAESQLSAGDVRIACTDPRGAAVQWKATSALSERPEDIPTREVTLADLAVFRKRSAEVQKEPTDETAQVEPPEEEKKKKKSRRGRRGRKKKTSAEKTDKDDKDTSDKTAAKEGKAAGEDEKEKETTDAKSKKTKKRRRPRRSRKKKTATVSKE